MCSSDLFEKRLTQSAKDVLKDLSGLKHLFPRLDFDSKLARAIKITHGFDQKTQRAWVEANLGYGPDTQPLFEQEIFSLTAEKLLLKATSRIEAGVSGGQSRTTEASVLMDLVFIVGGTRLVTIRDALISYDDRRGMKFDIKPEKIEFNKVMQLVTDAIKKFNKDDSPVKLELVTDEATGRPTGLASKYDVPPISMGPILNAALGLHLILAQRDEFEIETFAYLGRSDAPFALIYGILGGGGFIEIRAFHRPESNRTDLAIAVSIGATAGAGFTFGPLAGSVSIYLGIKLTYFSSSGGSQLSIAAIIVINGSVSAWGFVTVQLGLQLALTYDGSQVVGVGSVSVTVKISRFFSKSFSRGIRYKPR